MANCKLLVSVILMGVFVQSGESIRCWKCTSDINPACGDPFVPTRSDYNYQMTLENCDGFNTYTYLAGSRPACKKWKTYINGEIVVQRGCTYKRFDDYSKTCTDQTSGHSNEYVSYCETCVDYDGCNGAAAITKTLALLLVPFGILLFK